MAKHSNPARDESSRWYLIFTAISCLMLTLFILHGSSFSSSDNSSSSRRVADNNAVPSPWHSSSAATTKTDFDAIINNKKKVSVVFHRRPRKSSAVEEDEEPQPHDGLIKRLSSSSSPTPKVAIAVLLTAKSKRGETLHRSVDSAAVLRRSILEVMMMSKKTKDASPVFSASSSLDFVAILSGSVEKKWDRVLQKIGWTKIRRYDRPPIEPEQIRNPQIAKEIVTDGAIGIDELLKLNVFEWSEYDVVVLLDTDFLFHKSVPELFQPTGKALRWTKGGWAIERINGGFLVIEPKGAVGKRYRREMLDVVLEGDFRPGTGWRGSGIGWTYGGRTVQGILPWYFLAHLKQTSNKGGSPSSSVVVSSSSSEHKSSNSNDGGGDDLQLDRCKYNNMDQLQECKSFPLENITSNHFTGDCHKPWWCGTQKRSRRCRMWVERWKHLFGKELKRHRVFLDVADTVERLCDFGDISLARALLEKEEKQSLLMF